MQMLISGIVIIVSLYSNALKAQICRASHINTLLLAAQKDKVQKIERLAALKFHNLLNEYRLKNKLEVIAWDEALWLTCRNHNFWMSANTTLAHEQKKGTKCYSGTEPGDRYAYATSGKGEAQWSGENALYFYNSQGKSDNEVATNIAVSALKQWKNSPGHNQNMLGGSHKAHGMAFCLSNDGRVYGTDLFVSNIDEQFCKVNKSVKKKV